MLKLNNWTVRIAWESVPAVLIRQSRLTRCRWRCWRCSLSLFIVLPSSMRNVHHQLIVSSLSLHDIRGSRRKCLADLNYHAMEVANSINFFSQSRVHKHPNILVVTKYSRKSIKRPTSLNGLHNRRRRRVAEARRGRRRINRLREVFDFLIRLELPWQSDLCFRGGSESDDK